LFYRLCVIPITIPPLRQRTQDILPLFHYFLKKEHCQASSALTPAQEAALTSYSWPGNVRELENAASYLQALGTLPPNVLLPYEKENSPMSSTPMSAPMEKTSGPKVVGSMTEASPWESPDPSIDRKRTSLSTKEVLICKILSLIYSRAQVYSSTGRTVILTELRRDGFLISDNQLRRLLSELREEAFISYGKGRSGILLTEAGRKRVEAVLPTSL
jgi:hypothetical protein